MRYQIYDGIPDHCNPTIEGDDLQQALDRYLGESWLDDCDDEHEKDLCAYCWDDGNYYISNAYRSGNEWYVEAEEDLAYSFEEIVKKYCFEDEVEQVIREGPQHQEFSLVLAEFIKGENKPLTVTTDKVLCEYGIMTLIATGRIDKLQCLLIAVDEEGYECPLLAVPMPYGFTRSIEAGRQDLRDCIVNAQPEVGFLYEADDEKPAFKLINPIPERFIPEQGLYPDFSDTPIDT